MEIKKMGEMIFRGKEFKSFTLREIKLEEMLIRHLGGECGQLVIYTSISD